jgi:hypothetical protein
VTRTTNRRYDSHDIEYLFRYHSVAMAHMRERIRSQRFGLVLGAGASSSLGLPNWDALLQRIGQHQDVDASSLTTIRDAATLRTQLLYQHFRSRRMKSAGGRRLTPSDEVATEVAWRELVHDCLYGGTDQTHEAVIRSDKYLQDWLPVIRQSPLTINYNFDDTLQRLLMNLRPKEPDSPRGDRGHSTIWSSRVQFPRSHATIYHPNGFLPFSKSSQASEELVFLEAAFADQLVDSVTGKYTTLVDHFAQTTCLLLGLSLNDPTLRHVLRQNVTLYPGHVHYYVRYVGSEKADADRYSVEKESNLSVHGLVTLFLTDSQIAALGKLISTEESEFANLAHEHEMATTFRFFLVGPVGVGKTSSLRQLRSLRCHEEWPDDLPESMTKDPSTLPAEDLVQIDRWVEGQLEKKNSYLLNRPSGVDVVDRAPLDAFAFVPASEWAKRADELGTALQQESRTRRACDGHVIRLTGDPQSIEVRARRVSRNPSVAGIQRQLAVLETVYPPGDTVSVIDTRNLTSSQVVKAIVGIIHQQEPRSFNFGEALDRIAKGQLCVPSEAAWTPKG